MGIGDCGERVVRLDDVGRGGRRQRNRVPAAGDGELLARDNHLVVVDEAVERHQVFERHAVGEGDERERVTGLDHVGVRGRRARGRRLRTRPRGDRPARGDGQLVTRVDDDGCVGEAVHGEQIVQRHPVITRDEREPFARDHGVHQRCGGGGARPFWDDESSPSSTVLRSVMPLTSAIVSTGRP